MLLPGAKSQVVRQLAEHRGSSPIVERCSLLRPRLLDLMGELLEQGRCDVGRPCARAEETD